MVKFVIRGECTSSIEANTALNEIVKILEPEYSVDSRYVVHGVLNPSNTRYNSNTIPAVFTLECSGDFEVKHALMFRNLNVEIQSDLAQILCWYTYNYDLRRKK